MVNSVTIAPEQLYYHGPADWVMQEFVSPARGFVQYGAEYWGKNIDIPLVPESIERLPESWFEGVIGTDFALATLVVMIPAGLADIAWRFYDDETKHTLAYLVDGVMAALGQVADLVATDTLLTKKPFEVADAVVSRLGVLPFFYEGLRVPVSFKLPALEGSISIPFSTRVFATPSGEFVPAMISVSLPAGGIAGVLDAGAVAAAGLGGPVAMVGQGNGTEPASYDYEVKKLISQLTSEQRVFVEELLRTQGEPAIDVGRMRRLFPEPAEGVPPNQWTVEQWVRVILEDRTTHPQFWYGEIYELGGALEGLDTMLNNIDSWRAGSFKYDGSTHSQSCYNNMPRSLKTGIGARNIWQIALERQRPELLARLRKLSPEEFNVKRGDAGFGYSKVLTNILDEIIGVLEGQDYRGLYDPTDVAGFGR